MKNLYLFCAAIVLPYLAFAAGPFDDAVLHGETDKERAIDYAPGEEMTFKLSLQGAKPIAEGEFFVKWTRTGDDGLKEEGRVDAAKMPAEVKTKLDSSGFVRLYANVVDKDGKEIRREFTGDATTPEGKQAMNRFESMDRRIFFGGGAGVKVDELKQAVPEPADFDAYHADLAKRLAAVPVKAEIKDIGSKNPKTRIYAISIDCAGPRPVTGYLSVPKAADDGVRFPARLETHGYSYNPPHQPMPLGRDNEILLNINAHGMKLPAFGADKDYYDQLGKDIKSNDQAYAFDPIQNANRDAAYFNHMFLRVKRALQYLKTRPEWDGKTLVASGGSQGGLQTIWAAGCGEGVTRAESSITWCCDMGGEKVGRNRGNWYIHFAEGLSYYDPVNLAKRVPRTCTTIIPRAGLGDYVCPPSGLAILFNNLNCPKRIVWVQGSEHGYVPREPHQEFTVEKDMN